MDRFSLGLRIENLLVEFFELVVLAFYKQGAGKILILEKADIKLKLLKFFCRVAYELQISEQKKYIEISEQIIEVGKILGDWIKKTKERQPAAPLR